MIRIVCLSSLCFLLFAPCVPPIRRQCLASAGVLSFRGRPRRRSRMTFSRWRRLVVSSRSWGPNVRWQNCMRPPSRDSINATNSRGVEIVAVMSNRQDSLEEIPPLRFDGTGVNVPGRQRISANVFAG